MYTLFSFYKSKEWQNFIKVLKLERQNNEGYTICEHCGKPIVKEYDCICHHKKELTDINVNDYKISLNPDNIALVHHKCHNYIHNKLGCASRSVYIIYGPPLSGKSSYVKEVMQQGDLIIDMDNIWQCVSHLDRYVKPNKLKGVVFPVRDFLIECVKYRKGQWNNAYVIGGYPLISERQRLANELSAREIYIQCDKLECIKRLKETDDSRDKVLWEKYIEEWFLQYVPPTDI